LAQHLAASRVQEGHRIVTVKLSVRNVTRGTLVASEADIADTSAKRRAGLLSRTGLEPGEGLWIVPCEGVHTFAMKFPIDVVYLNKSRKVLKIRDRMKKSRISFCLTAHSVLELPAGQAADTATQVGDQLEFEKRQVAP
jgi:uncharacterized membrane protein (UPF0127 family)